MLTTHRDVDAFYIIGTPKFAVWAIIMAKLFHKPVTLALTANVELFDKNANWRNRILASCDQYIATSHEIGRGYCDKTGISKSKVTV